MESAAHRLGGRSRPRQPHGGHDRHHTPDGPAADARALRHRPGRVAELERSAGGRHLVTVAREERRHLRQTPSTPRHDIHRRRRLGGLPHRPQPRGLPAGAASPGRRDGGGVPHGGAHAPDQRPAGGDDRDRDRDVRLRDRRDRRAVPDDPDHRPVRLPERVRRVGRPVRGRRAVRSPVRSGVADPQQRPGRRGRGAAARRRPRRGARLRQPRAGPRVAVRRHDRPARGRCRRPCRLGGPGTAGRRAHRRHPGPEQAARADPAGRGADRGLVPERACN